MVSGASAGLRIALPRGESEIELTLGRKKLRLTGLTALIWPELGIAKRDLLQYYLEIAPWLVPHLKDRAVALKRRLPADRPVWIRTCPVEDASGAVAEYPIVQDAASLLWLVNQGSIEVKPSPVRCDDLHRPDYLQFVIDPGPDTAFRELLGAALRLRDAFARKEIFCYAKTSGSRAMHIAVPIRRDPVQRRAWLLAAQLAQAAAAQLPDGVSVKAALWPLASVYAVRPRPLATVSAAVTWDEVERGFRMEEFRLDTMPERLAQVGDLWRPLTLARGRADLERLF